MRKLWKKAKRIMTLVLLTIISFSRKVFADTIKLLEEEKNSITPLYGVPNPTHELIIWRLAKGVIIPIALVIGMIIYLKKSKSGKKKKIIISLIVIAITVLVYFVGDIIISAYFM